MTFLWISPQNNNLQQSGPGIEWPDCSRVNDWQIFPQLYILHIKCMSRMKISFIGSEAENVKF